MNGYYSQKADRFIKVKCFTNIDDVICTVTKMVGMPSIGDKVEVIHRGLGKQTLTIVEITHCLDKDGSPFVKIELNRL